MSRLMEGNGREANQGRKRNVSVRQWISLTRGDEVGWGRSGGGDIVVQMESGQGILAETERQLWWRGKSHVGPGIQAAA
jgi:hypothetical protein